MGMQTGLLRMRRASGLGRRNLACTTAVCNWSIGIGIQTADMSDFRPLVSERGALG
jgi:hypothetical protein